VQFRITRVQKRTLAVLGADRALLAIAARQHGVVTAENLARAGVSRGAVARRVAAGRLRRVHCGVYLTGPLTTEHTRAMAAVLACGDHAALSHHAAGALWGIRPPWRGPVDVTVTARHPRPRGVRVHRAELDPRDIRRRHGVPTTAPARTLLDLAPLITTRELERAIEEARIQRLVTTAQLTTLLTHSRSRRGTKALRVALTNQHEPSLTRSEAERIVLEQIRAAGLPQPRTNARVLGHEVDFLWPEHKLIVEVDGYAYHSSREAFERDRRRDARLVAAGHRVIRLSYGQVLDGTIVHALASI
jgi:very-short-patch-repair endonuclease